MQKMKNKLQTGRKYSQHNRASYIYPGSVTYSRHNIQTRGQWAAWQDTGWEGSPMFLSFLSYAAL